MPVPVHDRSSPPCKMAVCLKAELPGVGKPAWISLGLRFQNQVGSLFDRTSDCTTHGNLCTRQITGRGVVDIYTCDSKRPGSRALVYFRLETFGMVTPCKVKILCQELIVPCVLTYDP